MNHRYAGILFFTALMACAVGGQAQASGIDTSSALLPPDGVYRAPAPDQTEFLGPGLHIVLTGIQLHDFTSISNTPIGADERENFDTIIEGNVSVNGGAFNPFQFGGPVSTMAYGKVGNPTGTFQTEMLSLDLAGNSPIGPFMVRESPTLISPGQTAISPPSGGQFHIDSFFDVFTELSIDGGNTWIPSSGASHLDLGPPAPEPTSIALFVLALAGIGAWVRPRR